jgi:L-lysine exporter family protein LysE/ArgO
MHAFATGFFLGLSLIVAIGAQNAFILRQGLLRQHIGALVLFCSLSDAALIWAGVYGLGELIQPVMQGFQDWLFALAALWLAGYGLLRLRAGWQAEAELAATQNAAPSLRAALLICAGLTFLNPHVWLDTVVLLGLFSLPFEGAGRLAYASGATLASFCFFTLLGYGAASLSGFFARPASWRFLEFGMAVLMLFFAAVMLGQTSWLSV